MLQTYITSHSISTTSISFNAMPVFLINSRNNHFLSIRRSNPYLSYSDICELLEDHISDVIEDRLYPIPRTNTNMVDACTRTLHYLSDFYYLYFCINFIYICFYH